MTRRLLLYINRCIKIDVLFQDNLAIFQALYGSERLITDSLLAQEVTTMVMMLLLPPKLVAANCTSESL